MEFENNRITLTGTPQGEGRLTLRDGEAADLNLSVRLRGNVIGTQTVYLRTGEDNTRFLSVAVQNNNLVIAEQNGGAVSTLFTYDLHDLVPDKDRVSVEEDQRDSLAAEYRMRSRFADSTADSAIFYQAARKAEKTAARSVAQGAEEYRSDISINQKGDG